MSLKKIKELEEQLKKLKSEMGVEDEDVEETDDVDPTDETEDETTEDEETEDASEEDLDAAAEKMAKTISASLGLEKIDRLVEALEKFHGNDFAVTKMLSHKSVKGQIKKMTADEKIVAFTKALLTKNHAMTKALSEGTDADGGYLFPNEFRAEIVKRLVDDQRLRSYVRVIPMRKDKLDIPTEGAKVGVFWGSENTAISTTTADFGTKQLVAYRMNAILYASRELVADATEVGIVDLIIDQFADAVGEEEDKVIVQGSGSGQPTGLTGVSGHHSVTCSGNLSFDNIKNLFYALPKQYRKNAVFLLNDTNVKELDKLKDNDGRYIWKDAVAEGAPPTLMGRPVITSAWVTEATIWFADLKRCYYFGDRERMSVETTTEGANTWEKHQVGIKVIERVAGVPVLADGIAALVSIP